MPYNPHDWYWIVGNSATHVYSSKRNIYVPITDDDYVHFKASKEITTKIPSEVELWDVLKNIIPEQFPDFLFDGKTFVQSSPDDLTKKQLISYAADKRWEKEVGGIVVNNMPVATDDRSKQMIMGARIAAESDSKFTTSWVGADGTVSVLTAPQIIAISDAVLDHVNEVFTEFAQVKKDVDSGKITKSDKVDEVLAPVKKP